MPVAPVFDAAGAFERQHVRPRAGRTLIVGSRVYPGRTDRRARYSDCIGVDMLEGEGVDIVADLTDPELDLGTFDHIECCSVLEHCRRPWLMAANLQRMLVQGGTLHLSAPFMWRPHGYPSDYWRFTTQAIVELFPRIVWDALRYGGESLHNPGAKLPCRKSNDGYPYYPRTEVFAFGYLLQ